MNNLFVEKQFIELDSQSEFSLVFIHDMLKKCKN